MKPELPCQFRGDFSYRMCALSPLGVEKICRPFTALDLLNKQEFIAV